MKSLTLFLATCFLAFGARAEPLVCGTDDEGDALSYASPEVCDLLGEDARYVPDEAYAWSVHQGRPTHSDQFVVLMRDGGTWELRTNLHRSHYEEREIMPRQPIEIDPIDADYWEDYYSDEDDMMIETIVTQTIEAEVPPSLGLGLRKLITEERLKDILQPFDWDAYFAQTGQICISHRILNVYIIRDGKAHHGSTLMGCGADLSQYVLTEAINGEILKYDLITPEYIEGVGRPPLANNE